jgi:hypothetical protein
MDVFIREYIEAVFGCINFEIVKYMFATVIFLAVLSIVVYEIFNRKR